LAFLYISEEFTVFNIGGNKARQPLIIESI